jgi:hypothetical protein
MVTILQNLKFIGIAWTSEEVGTIQIIRFDTTFLMVEPLVAKCQEA